MTYVECLIEAGLVPRVLGSLCPHSKLTLTLDPLAGDLVSSLLNLTLLKDVLDDLLLSLFVAGQRSLISTLVLVVLVDALVVCSISLLAKWNYTSCVFAGAQHVVT